MRAGIGTRIGRLKVIAMAPARGKNHYRVCECACGTVKEYAVSNLFQRTVSCGCHNKENQSKRCTTHGMTGRPEYVAWQNAKNRCYKSNHPEYKNYGARGIGMCVEWRNDFSKFYEDMGPRPKGLSLEREDVNGDYCPENCVWADWKTQANNTRLSPKNRMVSINGTVVSFSDAMNANNIAWSQVQQRIQNGWSPEDALTKPIRHIKKRSTHRAENG